MREGGGGLFEAGQRQLKYILGEGVPTNRKLPNLAALELRISYMS